MLAITALLLQHFRLQSLVKTHQEQNFSQCVYMEFLYSLTRLLLAYCKTYNPLFA